MVYAGNKLTIVSTWSIVLLSAWCWKNRLLMETTSTPSLSYKNHTSYTKAITMVTHDLHTRSTSAFRAICY